MVNYLANKIEKKISIAFIHFFFSNIMSTNEDAFLPIHLYPGGTPIQPLTDDVTYMWIEPLGGEILPGPIRYGAVRPDGKLAHHGIATVSGNHTTIQYYSRR